MSEIRPLSAQKIIELLEMPTADRRPLKTRIARDAPGGELIAALQKAQESLTIQILCDIVAERCESDAVPLLISYLDSPVPEVKNTAAEALGKIGDPRAGDALLDHFSKPEKAASMECMLAAGLGAVGYRNAIPFLIQALDDPNLALRGVSAWALGILGAKEAEIPLRSAQDREPNAYNKERIAEALLAIERVWAALDNGAAQSAVSVLIKALTEDSSALRGSAAWALGVLRAKEAQGALQRALAQEQYCPVSRRIREALAAIEGNDIY